MAEETPGQKALAIQRGHSPADAGTRDSFVGVVFALVLKGGVLVSYCCPNNHHRSVH